MPKQNLMTINKDIVNVGKNSASLVEFLVLVMEYVILC